MKTQALSLATENKTISTLDFSLIIEKDHKEILKHIRAMQAEMQELSQEGNFSPSFITSNLHNGGSKQIPCYNLNRDQYLLLATKYSAALRVKLIKAWREAESLVKTAVETNEFLIEDDFINRYNEGRSRIILNFFRRILDAKGIDSFIPSIEYTLAKVDKDKKERLLESFRTTYSTLIEEQSGSFGVNNAIQIHSTQAVLEAKNREFSRRSAAHKIVAKDKNFKKLNSEKEDLVKAYGEIAPKWFIGKVEILEDEDGMTFFADNADVSFNVEPASFTKKDGEVVEYMLGTVFIKSDVLYLQVTGAQNGTVFQTKTKNLEKAIYNSIMSVDIENGTYSIVLTKLK